MVAAATVAPMRRYVAGAAAIGLLNALVVLLVLLLIREAQQAGGYDTYTYGFFSYVPLTEYEPPRRFPWEYVLPPVVLAVLNGAVAALVLRRQSGRAS